MTSIILSKSAVKVNLFASRSGSARVGGDQKSPILSSTSYESLVITTDNLLITVYGIHHCSFPETHPPKQPLHQSSSTPQTPSIPHIASSQAFFSNPSLRL